MRQKEWEDESKDLNREKFRTTISEGLQKKLNRKYSPFSRFDDTYKGKDITFLTDSDGYPISLYIGKRAENGDIKGDFYSRRIKKREGEKITESHWDKQKK